MKRLACTIVVATAVLAPVHASASTPGTFAHLTRGTGGQVLNGSAYAVAITPDGRSILVGTSATNLAGADGYPGLFLVDRATGVSTRVTVPASGPLDGNLEGGANSISADGRYVAFVSESNRFVPGTPAGQNNAYLRDLHQGTTRLLSRNGAGAAMGVSPHGPTISADGRYVFLCAEGSLLPAGPGLYMHTVATGALTHLPSSRPCGWLRSSADGRFLLHKVVVEHQFSEAWLLDRSTMVWSRVDIAPNGEPASALSWADATLSSDGRLITFISGAPTGNATRQMYLRDRVTGTTMLVSRTPNGDPSNGDTVEGSISPDGTRVLFDSTASDLTGDANTGRQMYAFDVATQTVELASLPGQSAGTGVNATPVQSADSSVVAFEVIGSSYDGAPLKPFTSNVFVRTGEIVHLETTSVGRILRGATTTIGASATGAQTGGLAGFPITITLDDQTAILTTDGTGEALWSPTITGAYGDHDLVVQSPASFRFEAARTSVPFSILWEAICPTSAGTLRFNSITRDARFDSAGGGTTGVVTARTVSRLADDGDRRVVTLLSDHPNLSGNMTASGTGGPPDQAMSGASCVGAGRAAGREFIART